MRSRVAVGGAGGGVAAFGGDGGAGVGAGRTSRVSRFKICRFNPIDGRCGGSWEVAVAEGGAAVEEAWGETTASKSIGVGLVALGAAGPPE